MDQAIETGETVPSIDLILNLLHATGGKLEQLLEGLPEPEASEVERCLFAEAAGDDLIVHFRYDQYDGQYTLPRSTLDDFEAVIKTLRDGLARLSHAGKGKDKAIKTDAVANAFLTAIKRWPHANPSDVWWFIVSRAYCDPYNHPAKDARLNYGQSWKRTDGWALEEVLVRYYGPFLKTQGVNLLIADGAQKHLIVSNLSLTERLEADKIYVVLTGDTSAGPRFFGVIHVKASFAERRTDDVPLSMALTRGGFTSPLWTMDCKSTPGTRPVNRGELGGIDGRRSAKRKDIEDEGFFTGCQG